MVLEVAKLIINENYKTKEIDKILKNKKIQEKFLKLLESSKCLRALEYEFFSFSSRLKLARRFFIRTFA